MYINSEETLKVNPLSAFTYALKAPESKRQYPGRFKVLLDYLKIQGSLEEQAEHFLVKARDDPQWCEQNLMAFIDYQKERARRGEISENTIPNYYRATKLFCEMNDFQLNWKKISRGLPRVSKAANDRAPTLEEIGRIIDYPDRRIKAIVYTMVSSGIRIGAWDYLKWKHVIPTYSKNGEVLVAKLVVYAGDPEQYTGFVTPEAYKNLKEWMDFRKSYGEQITGESWVMRDIWQTTNITYGAKLGLATHPKRLKSSGIKRLLERALWEQGLRHKLAPGIRRHDWKAAHGFRKFYKTRAEQVMRPINVEITMGHNIGVSSSYYRPTDKELMEDYMKSIPLLTINTDTKLLEKQINELKENNQDDLSVLKRKLEEKNQEILSISMKNKSTDDKLNRLVSILVKEGVDGKPALGKEVFERLVKGEDNRLRFSTTDCEYQDLIEYDVPSEEILMVRKEKERRKKSSY